MKACRLCGRPAHDLALLDRAGVHREYGLARVDVDRVFERLPITALQGSRKVYVRRADVEGLLEANSYRPGERVRVPA